MANWASLGVPRGSYISPYFYVSNNLDKYMADINHTIINTYNQPLEIYFRVSYDPLDWSTSNWVRFFETSYDLLDGYKLNGLYLQLMVTMVSENELMKPYLQDLSIELKPYGYIENVGDLPVKPKIWIKKKNGSGTIQLINFSTGQTLELKDLNNDEEVYIDCENEEIVSSNQEYGVYRYDSHNDEYFELIRGDNYITSSGDFDLDIRYKGILLQE